MINRLKNNKESEFQMYKLLMINCRKKYSSKNIQKCTTYIISYIIDHFKN